MLSIPSSDWNTHIVRTQLPVNLCTEGTWCDLYYATNIYGVLVSRYLGKHLQAIDQRGTGLGEERFPESVELEEARLPGSSLVRDRGKGKTPRNHCGGTSRLDSEIMIIFLMGLNSMNLWSVAHGVRRFSGHWTRSGSGTELQDVKEESDHYHVSTALLERPEKDMLLSLQYIWWCWQKIWLTLCPRGPQEDRSHLVGSGVQRTLPCMGDKHMIL